MLPTCARRFGTRSNARYREALRERLWSRSCVLNYSLTSGQRLRQAIQRRHFLNSFHGWTRSSASSLSMARRTRSNRLFSTSGIRAQRSFQKPSAMSVLTPCSRPEHSSSAFQRRGRAGLRTNATGRRKARNPRTESRATGCRFVQEALTISRITASGTPDALSCFRVSKQISRSDFQTRPCRTRQYLPYLDAASLVDQSSRYSHLGCPRRWRGSQGVEPWSESVRRCSARVRAWRLCYSDRPGR
jgi:hypothetical protein